MKAMILAAGEGTRLRPFTTTIPKILVPVAGKPLIEYTILWLRQYGITEVVVNLHYLGDKVLDFLGDGSKFDMELSYSQEETLLGTAGGVKKTAYLFDETFIVIYGDILTNLDLDAMIKSHQERESVATIAILKMPNPWETGIVETDEEGKILSFIEKPPYGSTDGKLSNGGIYILEKQVLDHIPDDCNCDFGRDVFPKIIELGLPVYGHALSQHEYLMDIGSPGKYLRADEHLRQTELLAR